MVFGPLLFFGSSRRYCPRPIALAQA